MCSKYLKLLLLLPLFYSSGAFSTSIEEFLICQYEQRCDVLGDLVSDIERNNDDNNSNIVSSNSLYSYENSFFSEAKATDFSSVREVYFKLANDQEVETFAVKEAIQILEDDLVSRKNLFSYAKDEIKYISFKENAEVEYIARELLYLKQVYSSAKERKILLERLSDSYEYKLSLDSDGKNEIKSTLRELASLLDSIKGKVDVIVSYIEKDLDSEIELVKYLRMHCEDVE